MHPADDCCTDGKPGGLLNWAHWTEYVGGAHEKICQTFSASAKKLIQRLSLVMSCRGMTSYSSTSQRDCAGRPGKSRTRNLLLTTQMQIPPKCGTILKENSTVFQWYNIHYKDAFLQQEQEEIMQLTQISLFPRMYYIYWSFVVPDACLRKKKKEKNPLESLSTPVLRSSIKQHLGSLPRGT